MVTGSKVGDVFQCLRRAVLLQRVSSGSLSREAKYGTMAHELFADSLREAAAAVGASAAAKDAAVRSLIARHAEELWALRQTDEMAMQMMMAYVQPSQEWVGQFVQPHVAGGSARRSWAGGAIQRAKGSEPMSMSVTCVVDIEESISSAKWGVKGNIDAVVQVHPDLLNIGRATDQQANPPRTCAAKRATRGGDLRSVHVAHCVLLPQDVMCRWSWRIRALPSPATAAHHAGAWPVARA